MDEQLRQARRALIDAGPHAVPVIREVLAAIPRSERASAHIGCMDPELLVELVRIMDPETLGRGLLERRVEELERLRHIISPAGLIDHEMRQVGSALGLPAHLVHERDPGPCSMCGRQAEDRCSQLTGPCCHRSISFEQCLADSAAQDRVQRERSYGARQEAAELRALYGRPDEQGSG